jgi:hypothetical protein
MRGLRKLPVIAIGTAMVLSSPSLAAQAMYLAPAYRTTLPENTAVLSIALKSGGALDAGTTVLITDDQLVLVVPGRGRDVILLKDRTIGEVADDLTAKYKDDLVVTAMYPLHSARHIGSYPTPQRLPFSAKASSGQPEVVVGFGVIFAMAEEQDTNRDGLLSQTGFQLDLSGIHQFRGPGAKPAGLPFISQVYLQARLGLNSDQSLNVVSTDSGAVQQSSDEDQTGPQFEDAVEQADQIALSVQPEFVYPLRRGGAEFSIVPEYGVTWTRLEAYRFPIIDVEGDPQSSEQFFDDDLRAIALRQLNRTIPLRNYGINAVFRFIGGERPLFYVGGGYVQKQVVHRGIRFRRNPVTHAPLSNFLVGEIDAVDHGFWRGLFGARIPGVLDVRVDAVTPISRDVGPPILRLVLAKDFPIGR